ncbi:C39 family peptidase [Exiguobacterium flavidum]|uniref:C39 family peptidase n=1 Tax=Exiguobacterium flavidum TaxID=2184695 RepID=UPI000DF80A83|nr:C39 family peptidase [Exiguobacterium flavidum]
MRNRLTFLSALLLVSGTSVPVGAAQSYVTQDRLNLRADDSTSAKILTVLPKGTRIEGLKETKSWLYAEAGKRRGWVYKAYVREAERKLLGVKHISQLPEMPMGCEITSLTMSLNYKGHRLDKMSMAKQMKYSSRFDPTEGFSGSPYRIQADHIYQSIFPQALIKTAKKYRKDSSVFTGASSVMIEREVRKGNPVIAYVTYQFKAPVKKTYRFNGKAMRLVENMHVLVVSGVDRQYFYVTDPIDTHSRYAVDKTTFIKRFDSTGRMALVIR